MGREDRITTMNNLAGQPTLTDPPQRPLDAAVYRELVRGTNINEETLLATDYLNHFNEVVMLMEMLEQSPEFIDDVRGWRPLSYVGHFHHGGFRHKALAIAAYACSPVVYRLPFDETVAEIDRAILGVVAAIEKAGATSDAPALALAASNGAREARQLIDQASAIINGHSARQAEIDVLIAGVPADQQPREKNQAAGAPEAA
jgi:hypothetical protein